MDNGFLTICGMFGLVVMGMLFIYILIELLKRIVVHGLRCAYEVQEEKDKWQVKGYPTQPPLKSIRD